MSITKRTEGGDCEFIMPARVDGTVANQLEEAVLAAMREGFARIFINLSPSNFLCSAGLRVILQYHRQMKHQGRTLLVSRASPAVDEILDLTGFKDQICEKI